MSSKLTIDNLHLIITELLSAKNEWREIGRALGLKDFDIEGINSTNPQRALSAVLSTILKMKSLTWGKLIDVLREPLVAHGTLANTLSKKYDRSKWQAEEETVAKVSKQKRSKRKSQEMLVSKPKRSKRKGPQKPGPSKKQKLETLDDSSSEDDSTDDVPTNKYTVSKPKRSKRKGLQKPDSSSEDDSTDDVSINEDTDNSDEEQSSNEDQTDTDFLDSPQPYSMKNRQALIINIVKHPTKERHGSDKDKDALKETLNILGYTVHVKPDLKRDEIIPKVVKYAKKDKHCDSFICCILAHGSQGVVCGSDGKKVEIKEISKALNMVKQLKGKPKIFFFQACQGSDAPKAEQAEADDGSNVHVSGEVEIDVTIPKLPRDSDFFYGCASSFETISMRVPSEGSLYIQALCRVLKEKYKTEDLLTMVTTVHYLVAKDERSVRKGGKDVFYQQQPQLVSTLRKLVHF